MVPVLPNFSGGAGWGGSQDQTALSQSIANAAAGQESSLLAAQHARFLADWRGLNEDLNNESVDFDAFQLSHLTNGHSWVTQISEVSTNDYNTQDQSIITLPNASRQSAHILSTPEYPFDLEETPIDLSDGRRGPREDFNTPNFHTVSSHPAEGSLSTTNADSGQYSLTKDTLGNLISRSGGLKSISNTNDSSGRGAIIKSTISFGKKESPKIHRPSKDMSTDAQNTGRYNQEAHSHGISKGSGAGRAQNSDDPDSSDNHAKVNRRENGRETRPTSIPRNLPTDAYLDNTSQLPAEKGFPIQIGSELFRLSGASIRSDG